MTDIELKKNIEIFNKIEENNKLIAQVLSPNLWVLNNTVADLIKENEQLQKECTHKFEDGFCVFCYKAEEE